MTTPALADEQSKREGGAAPLRRSLRGTTRGLLHSLVGDGDATSRAVRVAVVVLAAQLVLLLLWSSLLYSRWDNTWDYGIRFQGWWGIAHGNLDPFSSIAKRYFWQDHFELINWPIAPISRLWPNGLWPLWIQDCIVFAGELGAVLLVADATRRERWPERLPTWAAIGLVTILLIASPWIYESVSFDFHYQSVGAACFAILACREMFRGNLRWLGVWTVLCLSCGDIAATYLVAVGLGGLLAGKRYRRRAAILVLAGIAWFVVISAAGGDQGSGLNGLYGYVLSSHADPASRASLVALATGVVLHPGRVVRHMWSARVEIWAYVTSAGAIGLLTPLVTVPALVLLESGAAGPRQIITTPYENFAAVLFLIPLGVLALGWWAWKVGEGVIGAHRRNGGGLRILRSRRTPLCLGILMVLNALIWAVVWIPQVPTAWLRVSPSAAGALDRVSQKIPQGSEVVASQGVIGRLSGRQWCYAIQNQNLPFSIPLHTRSVYFVVVPYQGIETSTVETQLGVIDQLAGQLHAQLLLHRDGVWLFRLHRQAQEASVRFSPSPTEPAWAAQTSVGVAETDGPVSYWHMALRSPRPGYVLDGSDYDLLTGHFTLTVTMSTSSTTRIQVWDSSADRLLSQRYVPPTNGLRAVQESFDVTKVGQQKLFSGWGPYSFAPYPPTRADRIEVRVWSKGEGEVDVYSVEVVRSQH